MWDTNFPTKQQMDEFGRAITSFISILPRIGVLLGLGILVIAALYVIATLFLRLANIRRMLRQPFVFIELTPHTYTEKTPEETQRLFITLHGLNASRSILSRLTGQKVIFALEDVSTRESGLRFMMRVPERQAAYFEQSVASYLPSIQTKRVADYLPANSDDCFVLEFKQSGNFAYPLQAHTSINSSDPYSYVMGAMTKLGLDELMAFQLVVSPVKVRKAEQIAFKLLHNEEMLHNLGKRRYSVPQVCLQLLSKLLFGLTGLIGDMNHGPSRSSYTMRSNDIARKHDVAARVKPARVLSAFEQELADSVNDKVRQQLFRVSIRLVIKTSDPVIAHQRLENIQSALSVYSVQGYQGLQAKHNLPGIFKNYRNFAFRNRLLSPFIFGEPNVLSATELASLFHFPVSPVNKPENTVASLSKTLPATPDIKRHADSNDFDVVLGKNVHQGEQTLIGLMRPERERHMYIIGGTGNGKTTMLEYMFLQDIQNGYGGAMIDPHGDSARKMLKFIPKERINDVIYMKPRDLEYNVGINLLELPDGLTGSELAHEKDRVTEAILSVLQKVFDDNADTNAYRIERTLRNAIHTAFTVEDATIFTVLRLLTDSKFRKSVTSKLPEGSLKRFWKEELGKAGEFQRVKISGGPIARIERYERSEAARRILEQPKSTIDFYDIMNSGKILICNFSKSQLGEDTSTLFGITILAKLQLAAWNRDDIPEDERRPFYLYVDEFQNFASNAFMGFFTEARKYRLYVTMAQQSVSQLKDQSMLNNILDNVGTMVAFRSMSQYTEEMLLNLLSPFIQKGEIGNLPSYNFYIKIAAEKPQEPMSGETIPLAKALGSDEIADKVIEASRTNYARRYSSTSEIAEQKMTSNVSIIEKKKYKTTSNYVPQKKPTVS